MSGSNVVPMPFQAPAGLVSAFPAGCCPPGGMSNLMQCYCDIQAATQFICAIMVDCINTNPAVTEAIIAAIEKSGSSLPLIGVTNGSDAQPGQVGEIVNFSQVTPFTASSGQVQQVTMGILQPGDWDLTMWADFTAQISGASVVLSPLPAGMNGNFWGVIGTNGVADSLVLVLNTARASLAVPTLFTFALTTNITGAGQGAGDCGMYMAARRRR